MNKLNPVWITRIVAVAGAALLASIHAMSLPWIAVDPLASFHEAQRQANILSIERLCTTAGCVHDVNTTFFVLASMYLAWIAVRGRSVAWVLAGLSAGALFALSPFATAAIVEPAEAGFMISILLFLTMVSDVVGAVPLPTRAKYALAFLTVLQDPIYILCAAGYAGSILGVGRATRLSIAGAAIAGLTLRIALQSRGFELVGPLSLGSASTQMTIVIFAVIAFVIAPVTLYAIRARFTLRLGLGRAAWPSGVLAMATLLQGLVSSPAAPSYWLAAEAAAIVALVFWIQDERRAFKTLSVVALAALGLQGIALANTNAALSVQGISSNAAAFSEALAQASHGGDPICLAGSRNGSGAFPSSFNTIYGPVNRVSKPEDCVQPGVSKMRLLTDTSNGLTDWGSGGVALLHAAQNERNAQHVLHVDAGIVSPKPALASIRGAFPTAVASPSGTLQAFVTQAGFLYTFRCAWTGAHHRLSFAAANPLQNYAGSTPVRLTVVAAVDGRTTTLLQRDVMPENGPIKWEAYDLALPDAKTRCGTLTFGAASITERSIGTWASFVAPAIH